MTYENPHPPLPPPDLNCETPPPTGNAALLVRLAAIFSLVMCGLDIIYGLFQIAMSFFMYYMLTHAPPPPAGAAAAAPPPNFIAFIYIPMGILSIIAGTIKLIAGLKLLKRGRNVWGWGLAAGITGCIQVWCSIMCVVPMAAGVYTIVILCFEHVRAYLRQPNLQYASAPPSPSPPS